MKKLFISFALLLAACMLIGCGGKDDDKDSGETGTVILHCDGCGKEVEYPAEPGNTEDLIILCPECQEKLYN